ncbi:hypothetical protein B6U98_05185 [Thermoplasmatales archaeon ex4572_165]|nr:MAG: hypothetical protein B6U98_05185 [Thermoplasmatales archaeon ex4572_165]
MRKIKKNQIVMVLITITFLLSAASSLLPIVSASNYTITIKDINFQKTGTKTIGANTIKVYTINVILTNEGDETSDSITVELLDDGVPINKEKIIAPGESKTYIFEDTPFISGEIEVRYYPTDREIDETTANSGNTTIQLGTNSETTESTPYVNIIFMFGIIIFISYVIKKGRNRI